MINIYILYLSITMQVFIYFNYLFTMSCIRYLLKLYIFIYLLPCNYLFIYYLSIYLSPCQCHVSAICIYVKKMYSIYIICMHVIFIIYTQCVTAWISYIIYGKHMVIIVSKISNEINLRGWNTPNFQFVYQCMRPINI